MEAAPSPERAELIWPETRRRAGMKRGEAGLAKERRGTQPGAVERARPR